ncbi:hypothetical protein WEU32_06810 [Brevundimonas sp. BH3]|uniref:hypothetical protein n=1 Tax=Brevundimonas sp. BH3 TaxID=3133089 RepID=UPI00324E08EA
MIQFQEIVAGDRLWNGAVVTADLAKAYNAISANIALFESEGRTVPEHLLNGRHNLLSSAV